ncbi:hypothetical protein [Acidovorax sp. BL-A-41-H1]|uniref:hypothetical protein n=1 Tax=Acidovorax sp. BL-A-41-H1 TaxID=3421102 RepID=UPI003F78C2D7
MTVMQRLRLPPAITGPAPRRGGSRVAATAIALAGWSLAFAVSAAPAPWYYWRSTVDGARVCAQVSPGPGWERDSAPYEGPGCQPRRKVLVVPMR